MTVELDGRQMYNRVSTHDHLQQRLELPDYYGRNLDALYDLLTEHADPLEIVVWYPEVLKEQLGRYGDALLRTLQEAAGSNPSLTIRIE